MSGQIQHSRPTPLAFGSDELKHALLRDFLTGRSRTCLLYSEPGAGSDLAAVTTAARRDGDRWVVGSEDCGRRAPATAEYQAADRPHGLGRRSTGASTTS